MIKKLAYITAVFSEGDRFLRPFSYRTFMRSMSKQLEKKIRQLS